MMRIVSNLLIPPLVFIWLCLNKIFLYFLQQILCQFLYQLIYLSSRCYFRGRFTVPILNNSLSISNCQFRFSIFQKNPENILHIFLILSNSKFFKLIIQECLILVPVIVGSVVCKVKQKPKLYTLLSDFGYKKTAVKCSIFTTVCFNVYSIFG